MGLMMKHLHMTNINYYTDLIHPLINLSDFYVHLFYDNVRNSDYKIF